MGTKKFEALRRSPASRPVPTWIRARNTTHIGGRTAWFAVPGQTAVLFVLHKLLGASPELSEKCKHRQRLDLLCFTFGAPSQVPKLDGVAAR